MRRLVVVAITAGCWTDSSSPPKAPEPPAPVAVVAPAPAAVPVEPAAAKTLPPPSSVQTFGMTGIGAGGGDPDLPLRGSNPASTHPPTVRVGAPTGPASIPPEVIRHVVHEHLRQLSACYEKALETDPKLAGAVRVQFTIGPDGRVVQSHGEGLQANVDDCIATVISTARFPVPADGGSVVVEYPFNFTP